MSSRNLQKLNPEIFLEAARRIDELESYSILHAITMATWDANVIHNPQWYIDAWRREFEVSPGYPLFPGSNMKPHELVNSLKRMAYLAEQDNGNV